MGDNMDTTTSRGPGTGADPAPGIDMHFDHWSSKMAYSPYDVWARLRNECPVARTDKHGGFFVLSRYDDVFAAALNTETFSSDGDGLGVAIPPQDLRPLYPIDLDPPYHTRYRQILNPFFNMRTVARMEDSIRGLARELIAAFPASGVFDVAAAFTLPLPRRVGFQMLSFPEERTAEVSELVEAVMSNVVERQGAAAPRLFEVLSEILAERRAKPRRADLLDTVVFGEVDGVPVDEKQSFAMLILLLMGGLATTSAALGVMIECLADHPRSTAARCRRGRGCCSASARPTGTTGRSDGRTRCSSTGSRISTWASGSARTAASGRTWPSCRSRSPWRSCWPRCRRSWCMTTGRPTGWAASPG